MAASGTPVPLTRASRDQIFPALTPAQVARVAAHGRTRAVQVGDLLFEVGNAILPFFVVASGQVEVVRPGLAGDALVTTHRPGEFTGEVEHARPAAARWSGRAWPRRARSSSWTARICWRLVQTDSEMGEIIMRAFILRRLELIAHGLGDVVADRLGACAGTLRVKEFLTRNGHPYSLPRPRPRRGGRRPARPLPRRGRRRAGRDLPRRGRAAEPDQRRDRRLPRVQRSDRRDARARCGRSSARDRRGSRPRSTRHPRGSTSW